MHRTIGIAISIAVVSLGPVADAQTTKGGLYFPTAGEWDAVSPAEVGWDQDKLDVALAFAGKSKSSGVVILYAGRILAEQYWQPDRPSFRYRAMTHGTTKDNRAIEDVASAVELAGPRERRGCQWGRSFAKPYPSPARDPRRCRFDTPEANCLASG